MICLNERYYFTQDGSKKITPTREQIREHYNLDEKIKVVATEFPNVGYAIQVGYSKPYLPQYETREDAEKARLEYIESEIDYYIKKIK